jgi:hypothetical protein
MPYGAKADRSEIEPPQSEDPPGELEQTRERIAELERKIGQQHTAFPP